MTKNQAKFISIEGVEGTGKSTLVAYICELFLQNGIDYICTREPGGTPVAEAIRGVLLQSWDDDSLQDETELMLMYASRMQLVRTLIQPALAAGQWVISDRFADASMAYQGGGRGIDIDRVRSLSNWVLQDFAPDLTILLDAPLEVSLARIAKRSKDRIESEPNEFFARVKQTYLDLASNEPERFKILDASLEIAQVCENVKQLLQPLLVRGWRMTVAAIANNNLMPWHDSLWRRYQALRASNSLPHALCLHGPAGIGKHEFSSIMVASLLCTVSQNTDSCGSCKSCVYLSHGSHPDLLHLDLEPDAMCIGIDSIRGCIEFMQSTPIVSPQKLVVIASADRMNSASYNALLKILESPPGNGMLLLICQNKMAMPMTVRSRCQFMRFDSPTDICLQNWLQARFDSEDLAQLDFIKSFSTGMPLYARSMLDHQKMGKIQTILKQLLGISSDIAVLQSILINVEDNATKGKFEVYDILLCMHWVLQHTLRSLVGIESYVVPRVDNAKLNISEFYILYGDLLAVMRQARAGIALGPMELLVPLYLAWIKSYGAGAWGLER